MSPETVNDKSETGKEVIVDLFRGFSILAERITALCIRMERLEKAMTDDRLAAKFEDLTGSLDDHRSTMNDSNEVMDGVTSILGAFLGLVEEAGKLEKKSDEPVTWSDLADILKSFKEEEEDDDSDEDDDDSEDK